MSVGVSSACGEEVVRGAAGASERGGSEPTRWESGASMFAAGLFQADTSSPSASPARPRARTPGGTGGAVVTESSLRAQWQQGTRSSSRRRYALTQAHTFAVTPLLSAPTRPHRRPSWVYPLVTG